MNRLIVFVLIVLCLSVRMGYAMSIPVTVEALKTLVIYPQYQVFARVVAPNTAQIQAESSGRIIQLAVDIGDRVGKRELLLRLDTTDQGLQIKRSEARLAALDAQQILSEFQLQRAKRLASEAVGSKESVIQSQSQLDVIKAQRSEQQVVIQIAQRAVTKARLLAPFAALVSQRFVNMGEFVTMGTPLFELVDTDRIEVVSYIDEHDILSFRNAKKIDFNYQAQTLPLITKRVLPLIDEKQQGHEVRLILADKTSPPPGATGMIVWHSVQPQIPAHLLVSRDKQLGVFIVREDIAKFMVLPSAVTGNPVSTTLPLNTLLVLDGRHALQDGATVIVSPGDIE